MKPERETARTSLEAVPITDLEYARTTLRALCDVADQVPELGLKSGPLYDLIARIESELITHELMRSSRVVHLVGPEGSVRHA